MEFISFFMFIAWNALLTSFTFGKERDRTMLFPDYFFFAEKRLENHEIETQYVKDLDQCELFCYMNDNCVSANFKKEPDTSVMTHVCELNNATHLDHDTDLITDADFYYRGSKNACGKNPPCQNNATCQSGFTIKGYRCSCPPGFEGEHCEKDIDECQKNTHDCHLNATCRNTNGSFVCTCLFGFNGDGRNCTDIDECAKNISCHVNANCTNTIGSHVCTCHTGYTGDGQTCSDVDECAKNLSCHVNANCTNTIGSHVCTCHTGYAGDGQTCSDIDECSQTNICDEHASCSNNQGSYSCACDPKYIWDGLNCKANPCYNYSSLSDADRKSTYDTPNAGEKCDDDSSSIIFGKWYRFVGDAGTKMPTQCIPRWKCGTASSGWLKGGHPGLADGEVSSQVCFNIDGDCCKKSININVKDCGSYFVYELQKPPACPLRYCSTD